MPWSLLLFAEANISEVSFWLPFKEPWFRLLLDNYNKKSYLKSKGKMRLTSFSGDHLIQKMALNWRKSVFGAILSDSTSVFFKQRWCILTNFCMLRTNIICDVTADNWCCLNPVWFQIWNIKKIILFVFMVPSQILKTLSLFLLIWFSLELQFYQFPAVDGGFRIAIPRARAWIMFWTFALFT